MEANEESMDVAMRQQFREGMQQLLTSQPDTSSIHSLIDEMTKLLVSLCVTAEVPKLAVIDYVEDMYESAHQARLTASLLFGSVKNLPDA